MDISSREIKKEALEILLKNRKEGFSPWAKIHYSFSCPALSKYPFQWFWDSCFHTIALSHLDPRLAILELKTLLLGQEEDGFIPHVLLWQKASFNWGILLQTKQFLRATKTSLIQPPVLAQATEVVFQKINDRGFLKEVLPKVEKFYLWLSKNRDPDKDNLISIINSFESGLDQKPSFDIVWGLKGHSKAQLAFQSRKIDFLNRINGYDSKKILAKDYFNVEDVMVNCIYAQGLIALSRLFKELKEEEKERFFLRLGKEVEKAILKKCFDEKDGLFYDLYTKEEKKAKVKSVTCFFPLILETIDKEITKNLIEKHLLNKKEFWLPFPIPSVAACESFFDPSGSFFLWRGPTWVNTNWFIVKGLLKHGYKDIAAKITQKTKELISKEGFWEFYHPLTGKGEGAKDFGWTTLIVDMLESEA